jgi:hypothetical protein
MTNSDFSSLFVEHVTQPLRAVGFVTAGQSLYFDDAHKHVALIRGGGRLARPGAIVHILALRFVYMRDTGSDLSFPSSPPRHCESYPYLLDPNELHKATTAEFSFDPEHHWRKPWGYLHYQGVDDGHIIQSLKGLTASILERWLPLGDRLTPKIVQTQLSPHLEKWWNARIWHQDCQTYLQGNVNKTA